MVEWRNCIFCAFYFKKAINKKKRHETFISMYVYVFYSLYGKPTHTDQVDYILDSLRARCGKPSPPTFFFTSLNSNFNRILHNSHFRDRDNIIIFGIIICFSFYSWHVSIIPWLLMSDVVNLLWVKAF